MKYLCLCYYDTAAFAKLDRSEVEQLGPACRPHDEKLKATGKLVVLGSLADPKDWCHFIPARGRATTHQGPYLPGNRQAGAFFIIEAATEEEAKAVASKHAAANFGEHLGFAVEVRACELYESYA